MLSSSISVLLFQWTTDANYKGVEEGIRHALATKENVPTVLVMIKTNLNPLSFRKNCNKKQNCEHFMLVLCQDSHWLSKSWRGFPGTCSRVNFNIKTRSDGVVSYMGAAHRNKSIRRCKVTYFFSDSTDLSPNIYF